MIDTYCHHLIGYTRSALHDCTSEITGFNFLVAMCRILPADRPFSIPALLSGLHAAYTCR